jgi:hypothetical protein
LLCDRLFTDTTHRLVRTELGECWEDPRKRIRKAHDYRYLSVAALADYAVLGHRVAYWYAMDEDIPFAALKGWLVCHRCDNPPCRRPSHLFLGKDVDNARDRAAKGRGAGRRTHCRLGHALTPDNVKIVIRYQCRTCLKARK